MISSLDPIASHYDDEARTVLLRYLRLAEPNAFQAVAVEVPTPAVREMLLAWLRATLPERTMRAVSLPSVQGRVLAEALPEALAAQHAAPGDVLVLTELEAVAYAGSEVVRRLNLERDTLVRAVARPWLVLTHPLALVRLRQVAPDFAAFLSTTVRCRFEATDNVAWEPLPELSLRPSAPLSVARPHWPALLRAADDALSAWQLDRGAELLAEFEAQGEPGWHDEVVLSRAWIAASREGPAAGLACMAALDPESEAMRGDTRCQVLILRANWLQQAQDFPGAHQAAQRAHQLAQTLGDTASQADALVGLAAWAHSVEAHLELLRQAVALYASTGRDRRAMIVRLGIAYGLVQQGDLDAAMALLQAEVLSGCERLGLAREKALAMGVVAEIFESRGDFEEALRIRRDEELPVYVRVGDAQATAVTQSQIADLLLRRGELDAALRLWRAEVLPTCERLGDQRAKADTTSKIAQVEFRRGRLGNALHLLQSQVLPILQRLDAKRDLVDCQIRMAAVLLAMPENLARKAEARQLLREAHRDALRMKLSNVSVLEALAGLNGIELSSPKPPPAKRDARRKRH